MPSAAACCRLPAPVSTGADAVGFGRQAIVLNVYTEPAFRRHGLARALMLDLLDWARSSGLDSLVLHATPDGRPLYEALGFAPTNEMRFMGELRQPGCARCRQPNRGARPRRLADVRTDRRCIGV